MGTLKKIRLCIAGSRDYPHLDFVEYYVWSLRYHVATIINGSTIRPGKFDANGIPKTSPSGVDRAVFLAARRHNIPIEFYPADWDTFGRAAGPKRNTQMVHASDHVVAFWDEKSKGTRNIIGTAKGVGKLRAVYGVTMGAIYAAR